MMQKINVRIVAFILILAFFQKLGLELWLHDWLHEPPSRLSVVQKDKASLQQAPIKCNCLDDTLMPLTGSVPYTYEAPVKHLLAVFPNGIVSISFAGKVYPALRGPPREFLL